jgi:predicted DNA-binding protein (MmcQ/YjbR family)
MTRKEFDAFCSRLKGATHVVQWGGSSVWKIGGKIFAICSVWGAGEGEKISFKCSDLAFDVLNEQTGLSPAPYLARAKWIQLSEPGAMSDEDIEAHIEAAYWIVAGKLPKAIRDKLGLTIPRS